MSNVVGLVNNESAADWLESLAAKLRARPRSQPATLLVFGLQRTDDSQFIEFWNGPRVSSPLEVLGMIEMGKASYIGGSAE